KSAPQLEPSVRSNNAVPSPVTTSWASSSSVAWIVWVRMFENSDPGPVSVKVTVHSEGVHAIEPPTGSPVRPETAGGVYTLPAFATLNWMSKNAEGKMQAFSPGGVVVQVSVTCQFPSGTATGSLPHAAREPIDTNTRAINRFFMTATVSRLRGRQARSKR